MVCQYLILIFNVRFYWREYKATYFKKSHSQVFTKRLSCIGNCKTQNMERVLRNVKSDERRYWESLVCRCMLQRVQYISVCYCGGKGITGNVDRVLRTVKSDERWYWEGLVCRSMKHRGQSTSVCYCGMFHSQNTFNYICIRYHLTLIQYFPV